MTTITINRATVEQALHVAENAGYPLALIKALRAALAQQAEPDAYGYASRLAVAIWEKHYKDTAPHWKPLDDLMGVLTQIDNMTSGLTRLAQQAEPVEPYCYVYEYDGVFGLHREFYPLPYNGMKPSRTVPVYTAPPQRKPLMNEEIDAIGKALLGAGYGGNTDREFARAVERAHKIGEGA